jgi:hypothetical protein
VSDSVNTPPRDAPRRARLAYLAVKVLSDMDPPLVVVPDAESAEVSLGADFLPADLVVQHLDLRLRLILLIHAKDIEALSQPSALRAAEVLLKHWPETAAVGLVANDSELSCLIVEPFDVEPSIGTPSGLALPPTPRRDALPIGDAVRRYLEIVVPNWERVPPSSELARLGYEDLAPAVASQVRAEIAARRANIDEKRAALDSLDEADGRWAARMVLEASSDGLDAESLAQAVERRVGRRR